MPWLYLIGSPEELAAVVEEARAQRYRMNTTSPLPLKALFANTDTRWIAQHTVLAYAQDIQRRNRHREVDLAEFRSRLGLRPLHLLDP